MRCNPFFCTRPRTAARIQLHDFHNVASSLVIVCYRNDGNDANITEAPPYAFVWWRGWERRFLHFSSLHYSEVLKIRSLSLSRPL